MTYITVVDDSPAAAAGIREGDLLVKAGDRDLTTPDDDLSLVVVRRRSTPPPTAEPRAKRHHPSEYRSRFVPRAPGTWPRAGHCRWRPRQRKVE